MGRQVSEYQCPSCSSRLTFSHTRGQDLFCKRCCAAVCLVDDDYFLYVRADDLAGLQIGQVADLMPQA